jgi:hypothetical protein
VDDEVLSNAEFMLCFLFGVTVSKCRISKVFLMTRPHKSSGFSLSVSEIQFRALPELRVPSSLLPQRSASAPVPLPHLLAPAPDAS